MAAGAVLVFFGVELAKGAIEYVGGKIAEQQLKDLGIIKDNLVADIISAVREVLRDELTRAFNEQEVRELSATSVAFDANLTLFLGAKKRSKKLLVPLLNDSLTQTEKARELSKRQKFITAYIHAAMTSYEIITLHAFYKLTSDPIFRQRAHEVIDVSSSYILTLLDDFTELNSVEHRLVPIHCDVVTRVIGREEPVEIETAYCQFELDGAIAGVTSDHDGDMDAARRNLEGTYERTREAIVAAAAEAERQYGVPLRETVRLWRTKVKPALKLAHAHSARSLLKE
jgi:hypothetical protein